MEDRKGVNGKDSSSPRSSAPSSGRSTPSPTKKGVKGDQKKRKLAIVQSSVAATNASSKKKQEKRVFTPVEKKQNAKNYYHQLHKSALVVQYAFFLIIHSVSLSFRILSLQIPLLSP